MKIVADQQIPQVAEAFARFGEVHLYPGRAIKHERLKDCDILLVRSVTRVNEALLRGHNIRFIASATSGIDHIDTDYLADHGIGFSHAPGSNARSVAEYVLSALITLAEQQQFLLSDKTVGIIGYGHVGSRVARFLDALNVNCVINDPPLADRYNDSMYRPIEAALDCDIITLHIPLNVTGNHPTVNLVNKDRIQQLRDNTIIINTARSEVLDEAALLDALRNHRLLAVIDVWQNEPAINLELLRHTQIGTPHIAGYSVDSRIRAADKIYTDCCSFFQEHAQFEFGKLPVMSIALPEHIINTGDVIAYLVHQAYSIKNDAAALGKILNINNTQDQAEYFDQLRRNYPERREFNNIRVSPAGMSDSMLHTLESLGFMLCQN